MSTASDRKVIIWSVIGAISVSIVIILLAMSFRPIELNFQKIYVFNGKCYGKDIVYWNGYCWSRRMYRIITKKYPLDYTGPYTEDDIIIDTTAPPIDIPIVYERKDLIYYCHRITADGNKLYSMYKRRRSKYVIVTDRTLDKPYVRLVQFTIGGKTPPNWKKVKKQIQDMAGGILGADAAIVEKWEILPFRQEDYFSITEFTEKEYVRYYCVAIAFEETAKIPEHLIAREKEKGK